MTFTIIATVTIITIATKPNIDAEINQPNKNELNSIKGAIQSTSNVYARESTRTLVQPAKNAQINSFADASANLTDTGSYNSYSQNASIDNFANTTSALPNIFEDIDLNVTNLEVENFTVSVSSDARISTDNMVREMDVESSYDVMNLTDPLMSSIGYDSTIEECAFETLVNYEGSGSKVNGTARGVPEKNPMTISPDPQEIFLGDITQYGPGQISGYAGYVSTASVSNPGSYNDNYVIGASSLPDLEQNQNIIIHDSGPNSGYWKSNLIRLIKENCYLATSLRTAPSISDRFENESRGNERDGVFTLVDISEASQATPDPSESNVGYERVDKPTNLVQISGVSTGDGIVNSSFRINESSARSAGLGDIIK